MQLRDRWANGKVPVQPGTSWTALYPQHLNPTPAAIADVRFRRALPHGIDRQELVDVLLYGLIPVAHSSISPSRSEYPDVERAIVRYDHDPRRAAQLLEGLGYAKGADGFYRDGAGQRLSVEIRSTGGDDFRDRELLTTAGHLQRVGVGVDTVFIPRQRATDREYRVTRPGFELVSQGTELRDIQNLHTRAIPTADTKWVGPNRGR